MGAPTQWWHALAYTMHVGNSAHLYHMVIGECSVSYSVVNETAVAYDIVLEHER